MIEKEVYKIWAPYNNKWSRWTKIIPFVAIKDINIHELFNYEEAKIYYIDKMLKDTAIFVDIAGVNAIKEGLALARMGYMPVVVFNGTNPLPDTLSAMDNISISYMLWWGAGILKNIKIAEDNPPVFLFDSNRLKSYINSPSVFDNSYDIYQQDVPTYKYLLKHGINNIIIRTPDKISKDLRKILYTYQNFGINILYTNGYTRPRKITLTKKDAGKTLDDKIFW